MDEEKKDIIEQMDDNISRGFDELSNMPVGSQEWMQTAKILDSLVGTYTANVKAEAEFREKDAQREHEVRMQEMKAKAEMDQLKTKIQAESDKAEKEAKVAKRAHTSGMLASIICAGLPVLGSVGLGLAKLKTYDRQYNLTMKANYLDGIVPLDKMFQNLPNFIMKI